MCPANHQHCKPALPNDEGFRLIRRDAYAEYQDNLEARPVQVGPATFGDGTTTIIAGPCAVESRDQTLAIARAAKEAGAHALRGGAFKPRTSPYEFQGLAQEGLDILAEAREITGLPIITEALDPRDVELVASVADCLQIGARSMQNFPLLREAGRSGKPVLLKRHWSATLIEWLCAAEYIAVEGNLDIILCERGLRTFSQHEYNRNTLDLNVIPAVRAKTFLPVVADPSHGTGYADMVPHAARAAVGAGAHGLIIEIVTESQDVRETLCDGPQAIRPSTLSELIGEVRAWESRRKLANVSG
jgi:3-deoxy-7-phosphoheptulonate synthase